MPIALHFYCSWVKWANVLWFWFFLQLESISLIHLWSDYWIHMEDIQGQLMAWLRFCLFLLCSGPLRKYTRVLFRSPRPLFRSLLVFLHCHHHVTPKELYKHKSWAGKWKHFNSKENDESRQGIILYLSVGVTNYYSLCNFLLMFAPSGMQTAVFSFSCTFLDNQVNGINWFLLHAHSQDDVHKRSGSQHCMRLLAVVCYSLKQWYVYL